MKLTSYMCNTLSAGIVGVIVLASYFWERDDRDLGDVQDHFAQETASEIRQSQLPKTASALNLRSAEKPKSYLVQATSLETARGLIQEVGGEVTADLNIIRAVAALLTDRQLQVLKAQHPAARVWVDGELTASGKPKRGKKAKPPVEPKQQDDPVQQEPTIPPTGSSSVETHFPSLVQADELHEMGIDGRGVTIAVIDTGLWTEPDEISRTAYGEIRVFARCSVLSSKSKDNCTGKDNSKKGDDENGHGTHVVSVIASSEKSKSGLYQGVAPGAGIVAVRAFDKNGNGKYKDVIKAIDWIYSNRKKYDIRVLNLSLSGTPRSHYWDDPLNQAVMAAWQAGIVVVAAAGNTGPDAMTVGVPGNVPYIVTVGAMTDNFTPDDASDDELASFSSAGPTYDGFVKPEIVAPGGHLLGSVRP